MTDLKQAAERKAFEQWAESEGIDVSLWLNCPETGYSNGRTGDYWFGWQARAALAAIPAPAQEPVFWWRPLRDGLYEGPVHHDSVSGRMLRDAKANEWKPLFTHPAPAPARCPNCDDTGDVHSITGEWRGVCHCPAGDAIRSRTAPVQVPVALESDEAIRIWHKHCDPFASKAGPHPSSAVIRAMMEFAARSHPAPVAASPSLIGYMSPKQVGAIKDAEGEFGVYIPMRKTVAGLFTLPLYTHRAPVAASGESEQLRVARGAIRELERQVFALTQQREVLQACLDRHQRDERDPPGYLQDAVIKAAGLGAMAEELAALKRAAPVAASPAQPVNFNAQGFKEWIARELPDDTIIGGSAYWADHLSSHVRWFLSAPTAAPVAAGWRWVPVEPTPEMMLSGEINVGFGVDADDLSSKIAKDTWSAMLAAAPSASPAPAQPNLLTKHPKRTAEEMRVISALEDQAGGVVASGGLAPQGEKQ